MAAPSSATEYLRIHHGPDGFGEAVLDLVIDRPERKNALSVAMYAALADGLAWASATEAVRVVRIRGAGGS